MTSSGQAGTNTGYIIFLSVASAIGGILFGYDTAVISGTIGSVTQQFSLDTMQQGWYVGCALIGSIIGALGKRFPQGDSNGFCASSGTLCTCLKTCRLSAFFSSILQLILSCTFSASGIVFPFP